VTEANGVVQISSNPTSNPGGANGLNSGGPNAASAKFSQRFGYLSGRAKEPPYGQYDGAPICTIAGRPHIDRSTWSFRPQSH